MTEIPTTPIIIKGKSNNNIFKEILVRDIITNNIFKFKYVNFSAN